MRFLSQSGLRGRTVLFGADEDVIHQAILSRGVRCTLILFLPFIRNLSSCRHERPARPCAKAQKGARHTGENKGSPGRWTNEPTGDISRDAQSGKTREMKRHEGDTRGAAWLPGMKKARIRDIASPEPA